MSLLQTHLQLGGDDENRDCRALSVTTSRSGKGGVLLSPVSANGIFARYYNNLNINPNNTSSTYSSLVKTNHVTQVRDTIESIPFKKFKNPFVSNTQSLPPPQANVGVVNVLEFNVNTLPPSPSTAVPNGSCSIELKSITNQSFTSMSISSIERIVRLKQRGITIPESEDSATTLVRDKKRSRDKSTRQDDSSLDTILQIAKKIMGEELIEDLVTSDDDDDDEEEEEYYNNEQYSPISARRFMALPDVKEGTGFDVSDFVNDVIEREFTVCSSRSWLVRLTLNEVEMELQVELDVLSVCSLGSSSGTVVIRRERRGRILCESTPPAPKRHRKRDFFKRMFSGHWWAKQQEEEQQPVETSEMPPDQYHPPTALCVSHFV